MTIGSSFLGSFALIDPNADPAGMTYIPGSDWIAITNNTEDHIYFYSGLQSPGNLVGSIATENTNTLGVAYDRDGKNLISSTNTDKYIYVHDGLTTTLTGSFASPANSVRGMTVTENGDLVSCSNLTGDEHIFTHDGISNTVTGSFASPKGLPSDVTYDDGTGNLISVDSAEDYIYVHSGISVTLLGSFASTNAVGVCSNQKYLITNEDVNNKIIWYSGTTYHTITTVVNPAGTGTITIDPVAGSYYDGQTITVSGDPANTFGFDQWTGDLTGSENPANYTMTSGNKVVSGNFVPYYPVEISAKPTGTGTFTGVGSYISGTNATIEAIPENKKRFVNWTGSQTGSDNPKTFAVLGSQTIIGSFIQTWTLTTTHSPQYSGIIIPSGTNTYDTGSTINLSATGYDRYEFGEWSGDHTGTDNPDTFILNGDSEIIGSFVRQPLTKKTVKTRLDIT